MGVGSMYSEVKPPEKRLAKQVVNVWVINDLIWNGVILMILGVLIFLHFYFTWPVWILWILIGIIGLTLLMMIWTAYFRPRFLYKNWRHDLDKDFLQIKSGAFFETHKLVPMTKVQSVETSQGPILRKYNLFSLTIETVASSHVIPALPKETAMALREQIAHYAKVKEVD